MHPCLCVSLCFTAPMVPKARKLLISMKEKIKEGPDSQYSCHLYVKQREMLLKTHGLDKQVREVTTTPATTVNTSEATMFCSRSTWDWKGGGSDEWDVTKIIWSARDLKLFQHVKTLHQFCDGQFKVVPINTDLKVWKLWSVILPHICLADYVKSVWITTLGNKNKHF